MPNDPYPGATFMSPSHSATLFVFFPLCLNLTYSSNGFQSSPSFSRDSSPHLIPLLCAHPLPSLSLHSFALSTMHPYPLSTYPFNHSTSLVPAWFLSTSLPLCYLHVWPQITCRLLGFTNLPGSTSFPLLVVFVPLNWIPDQELVFSVFVQVLGSNNDTK